jgi:predicted SprT family Zn-dependent metalloprotease
MTKVIYKKLRTAWGIAYLNQNKIELYDKLKGKKHLEIIIHEKLHLMFPDLDEEAIIRHSRDLCALLWKDGYRKIK